MTRLILAARITAVIAGVILIARGNSLRVETDRLRDLKATDPDFKDRITAEEHKTRMLSLALRDIALGVLLIELAAAPTLIWLNQKIVCRR